MNTKNTKRYSVSTTEDFEPNSNNEVLKNYLHIKSKDVIEQLEEQELERTELELLTLFDKHHEFTENDICNIHELWLGDIYPFAGKYRTVNISKDNFTFAAATRISALMRTLEQDILAKYTPCNYSSNAKLIHALSIVHIELILIHPFREGNGRTARLLADIMAMQANKPPLNYISIDQIENPEGFNRYILAIHAGINGDYEPMKEIFNAILKQSIT